MLCSPCQIVSTQPALLCPGANHSIQCTCSEEKKKNRILPSDFGSQAHATSSELHLRTSKEDMEDAVAAKDALMLMMLRVYLY